MEKIPAAFLLVFLLATPTVTNLHAQDKKSHALSVADKIAIRKAVYTGKIGVGMEFKDKGGFMDILIFPKEVLAPYAKNKKECLQILLSIIDGGNQGDAANALCMFDALSISPNVAAQTYWLRLLPWDAESTPIKGKTLRDKQVERCKKTIEELSAP
jgi:hypothetical protein